MKKEQRNKQKKKQIYNKLIRKKNQFWKKKR